VYISHYCRLVLVPPIFMKFGIRGQLTDVITCVKFLVDEFRGYGVLIPPKLPFPIDLLRRPYNSVALPCNTEKCWVKGNYSNTLTQNFLNTGSLNTEDRTVLITLY